MIISAAFELRFDKAKTAAKSVKEAIQPQDTSRRTVEIGVSDVHVVDALT